MTPQPNFEPIAPPLSSTYSHPCPKLKGKKIGCVVMAGGQATRFGSSLPKGVIPFSPVHKKSLLQIIAEKVKAYQACYDNEAYLAIMVSEANEEGTRALFERELNFGLRDVRFFTQPSLPLTLLDGTPALRDDGTVLTGPAGNGVVFHELVRSNTLQAWESAGLDALSLIQVDNPLVDPFCPGLIIPILEGTDFTAAAVERTDPAEKVGIFVQDQGKIRVIEYSELPPGLDKNLFRWANISQFACSPSFARQAAAQSTPQHQARKIVENKEVLKTEYFIFDHLVHARTPAIILLSREDYFAPVKDPESYASAQQALLARDDRLRRQIFGLETTPDAIVELPASALYAPDGHRSDCVP